MTSPREKERQERTEKTKGRIENSTHIYFVFLLKTTFSYKSNITILQDILKVEKKKSNHLNQPFYHL